MPVGDVFETAEAASVETDGEGPDLPVGFETNVAGSTAGNTCEFVGGYNSLFTFANRFRGNVFEVQEAGILNSFAVELSFTGEADLYFYVLEARIVGEPPNQQELYFVIREHVSLALIGTGRRFYTSMDNGDVILPILLEAGKKYVIGAAWGPEAITYGRNTLTYPRVFSHGRVLGSAAATLINGPPVDPEESGVVFLPATTGAYSMLMCFEPEPGACCCPDVGGSCVDNVLADACLFRNGVFQGERTSCETSECACGACCLPCGNCEESSLEDECASRDGVWQGEGSVCGGVNCTRRSGACCIGANCFPNLCIEECAAVEGNYLGHNSTCTPNFCAGACCIEGDPDFGNIGGCLDRTVGFCSALNNGTFQGNGTTCATLAQTGNECGGACCWGFGGSIGFCDYVPGREDCVEENFPNGHYLGDSTLCPSDCEDTNVNFTFGACCLQDGLCIVTTDVYCNAPWVQGAFTMNADCAGISCSAAGQGACCLTNGECTVTTESQCDGVNGAYRGDGTTCPPNPACPPPTGACCRVDGTCVSMTDTACVAAGGTYRGDGSTCPPIPACPPAMGACCANGGACTDGTPADCTMMGGTYQGHGTTCTPGLCPLPMGACCFASGLCQNVTQTACTDLGGTYDGDGSICDVTTFCPQPPQACCYADGSCMNLDAGSCTKSGGAPQGQGTTCGTMECPEPSGACCAGAVCFIETEAICLLAPGQYLGDGTVCGDPNPCAPTIGACCLPDPDCTEVTSAECDTLGGQYEGDGTECATAVCMPPPPLGACCVGETCTGKVTESTCNNMTGVFHEGAECLPGFCTTKTLNIVDSNPPNNAIDARQPTNIDGTDQSGWNSIDLVMDGDTAGLMASDFLVTVVPPIVIEPPMIVNVVPNGNTITLNLNVPIFTGHWTQFTHVDSGSSVCLGFLPGDVNASLGSNVQDVLALIDSLNMVPKSPSQPWQTDLDHSGTAGPLDVLREIDLLNGAGQFDPWNNQSLPASPCP